MENKLLIDKAIGFIQKNPKDNLSLQSIADHAGFSLTYFDAIFKRHTGYNPVEYARIYKLTRSALEIRKTEKTILEIALEFGYQSPESFTRAFKNYYSVTPSEYREKFSGEPVTWHDLSGKIAISHFSNCFPELKISDPESALDYYFTHNPLKYGEDIVWMSQTSSAILTLGDTAPLEHFVYVSDYNATEPAVTLICEQEEDAIPYLKLFASRFANPAFTLRKPVDEEWDLFDAEVAKLGLTCRYGYDMIYPKESVDIPTYDGMVARLLTENDMPLIRDFCQKDGCADCHVKAVQIYFDGTGNAGLRPMGLFADGELICFAQPNLSEVREFRKYDIGAIFTVEKGNEPASIEMIWKYAIDFCLKDHALLGNANALEDANNPYLKYCPLGVDPLGVEASERVGLIKVAKNCGYSR